MLLAHGASPLAKDLNENTSINLAVIGNNLSVLCLLLEGTNSLHNLDFHNGPLDAVRSRLSLYRRIRDSGSNSYSRCLTDLSHILRILRVYLEKAGLVDDSLRKIDEIDAAIDALRKESESGEAMAGESEEKNETTRQALLSELEGRIASLKL